MSDEQIELRVQADNPISVEDLAAGLLSWEADPAYFPDSSVYAVSFTLIMQVLGKSWVRKHGASPYLQPGSARMPSLAAALWHTRHAHGFGKYASSALSKSPECIFYELNVAHTYMASSASVEFVAPQNGRGGDFDLKAYGIEPYGDLNVEVKARTAAIATRQKMRTVLTKAAAQMPQGQPGAVAIKLAGDLPGLPQEELEAEISDVLAEVGRLVEVIYFFERDTPENELWIMSRIMTREGIIERGAPFIVINTPEFMTETLKFLNR